MHAKQVKCSLSVTFVAEHFWKLFVDLTLHLTEIISTYTALTKLHPQLHISKGRQISSVQKCSIMKAIANKCHTADKFTFTLHIAESLAATPKKKALPPPPFLILCFFLLLLSLLTFYFLTCLLTSDLLLTLFSSLSHSPCSTFSPPTPSASQ